MQIDIREALLSQPAENLLEGLKDSQKQILKLYVSRIQAGGDFDTVHMFLYGIANRTMSQTRAFVQVVEDRNSLVATALLRLQLDTAMRLYAIFWVGNAHNFCQRVISGEQIDKIKDASGSLLRDNYLRRRLTAHFPLIEPVYKETSGSVHFSARHIFHGLTIEDEQTGKASLSIGPHQPEQDLNDYHEVLAAFLNVTLIISRAVEDYFEEHDIMPKSS